MNSSISQDRLSVKTPTPVRLSVMMVAALIAISGIATYMVTSITGQENACAVSTAPTPLRDLGRC